MVFVDDKQVLTERTHLPDQDAQGWVQIYADQDYLKKSYFFSPLRLRQPQGPPTVPIVHGVGRGCRGHQPAVRVDVYRPFSPHAAVANKLLWCLLPGCFDST